MFLCKMTNPSLLGFQLVAKKAELGPFLKGRLIMTRTVIGEGQLCLGSGAPGTVISSRASIAAACLGPEAEQRGRLMSERSCDSSLWGS